MGGPLVFRTMAAVPSRMGAGGSFHGGGLVTDQPTSPHLLIPKMKGRLYVAVAVERRPAAAGREGQAEGSVRRRERAGRSRGLQEQCTAGACPTCRREANNPIYNKPEAEQAWSKLIALYKAALV